MNNIENKKEFPLETIKIYNTVLKEHIEVFKETTITSNNVECYRDLKYYLYPVVQCVQLIKEIKSFDEYQLLAARTLPDLSEYYGKETVVGLNCNDIHTTFGMFTEYGEILDLYKKSFAYRKPFDKINLLEEICDELWYVAGTGTINNRKLSEIVNLNNINFTGSLIPISDFPTMQNMIDVFLLIEAYQNRKSNKFIEDTIGVLVSSKEELFKALTNNINKLLIRYPDKFNNEKAVNRNLSEERKQLEQ